MQHKILLIFPFDLMSHYLRCIELAANYKEYSILFANSSKYNKYVIDAGYNTFYVEGFDPDEVMECSQKFSFAWLNKENINRVLLSQVKVINYYKPDLVIGDTSPTLKMASELTSVKYISLMNGYMTKYYAVTRALSRTHPGYQHLKKLPPKVADAIIRIAENISFRIIHKPFRQLRKANKLKKVANYLNEMEGDENLVCDKIELFPQKYLPANYKVIGSLIHNSKNDEEELLSMLEASKPTICICMGSSGNWSSLSFLSKPAYNRFNIITAGDSNGILKGNNIIAKQFVNLDKILPKCAYLICHGGNGTVYKGIEHKVFMLCLTSHFEQEWNVQMLETHKFGISVNENTETQVNNYLTLLK